MITFLKVKIKFIGQEKITLKRLREALKHELFLDRTKAIIKRIR